MDMFRSLDAVPVAITLPYLHTALEHHQIDGQEGMLPIVQYARLNEVQDHCAMTHHAWDGLWVCISLSAWNKLPDRLQNIVANTFNGAAQRQRDDSEQTQQAVRDNLAASGMTFTNVDTASFRELLRRQGYYARLRSRLGDEAWDVIQKATGVAS